MLKIVSLSRACCKTMLQKPVVDDSSLRATKTERKVRSTVIVEQGLGIDVCFLSRAVSSCASHLDLV
ncbi:hypothetical protein Ahy_A09g045739 [Arachis hypogaea]|uniref:Uncharacterized protein n=1 Tax=Arachis hypogaea TaxID=3818 RepID=A0A445BN35_ARAHY|nr:hypothetical protein Ahy_A09g045739 [Arachis hypogaea]